AWRQATDPGVFQADQPPAQQSVRYLLVYRPAPPWPCFCQRQRELPLPGRIDPHASGSGNAAVDDGKRRSGAMPLLQHDWRNRGAPCRSQALREWGLTLGSGIAATVEQALNQALSFDPASHEKLRLLLEQPFLLRLQPPGLELWLTADQR